MKKLSLTTAILALALLIGTASSDANASEVYLDKLDKTLDDWWNVLDEVCRGEPGGSVESNLACDQRLAVSELLKKKGCRNTYPGSPKATSYWLCKK